MILDMFLDRYAQCVFEGASEFARENGIKLVCAVTPVKEDRSPLRDLIGPNNADGVLFLASILTNFDKDATAVARFLERYHPLPCVSIGEAFEAIHSVTVDNRTGISDAIRHLVDVHGLRKIAFVRGPSTNQDAQDRFAAYLEVLNSYGIAYDPELVVQGNWSVSSGAAAARRLLEVRNSRFEAVVCANDAMATGAVNAFHAQGMIVPADIAVIGFDNLGESGYPLTTVNQPAHEIGRRAAGMLLDLVRGEAAPRQMTVPSELVVRQSCGCLGSTSLTPLVADAENDSQAVPMAERREAIVLGMMHALGESADGHASAWLGQLYDALVLDITAGPAGRFLTSLSEILRMQLTAQHQVNAWQGAIAVLKEGLLPCLRQKEIVIVANSLWREAELSIEKAARGIQGSWPAANARDSLNTVPMILNGFVQKLSALGIERCHVAVFASDEAVPQWSQVILSFDKQHGGRRDPEEQRYAARQLLPANLLTFRHDPLLALPLHKAGKHIGLIFFEGGRINGHVYESLRWQLSEQLWLASNCG